MDGLFAEILAEDPQGLILLAARHGHAAELLRHRFARRIPDVAERLLFTPWQSIDDYYRLLQLADVILDPPHYGAGSSCYDLFSFNLPVVTMPGKQIVGRITRACYRKMGVTDLIVTSPAEYVSKAVQVATDGEYRKYVTDRIAQASDVLFNDLARSASTSDSLRRFWPKWQNDDEVVVVLGELTAGSGPAAGRLLAPRAYRWPDAGPGCQRSRPRLTVQNAQRRGR